MGLCVILVQPESVMLVSIARHVQTTQTVCVCRVRQAQSHNIADSFLQENLNLQTHAGGLAKLGSLSPLWLVLLVPRLPVRSLDFTESHAHNLVQSKMQNVFHATTHFRKTPHGE